MGCQGGRSMTLLMVHLPIVQDGFGCLESNHVQVSYAPARLST